MGRQRIEKRKYPNPVGGIVEAEFIADDELGLWWYAPAGDGNRHNLDGLLLLPRREWWVAWWWRDADMLCTVDVVTPARVEDGVWVYDDLEIDLAMRESDGVVHVVDVDEFATAVTSVPYPADLIERAIGGMRSAEWLMRTAQPPFDRGFNRLRAIG